MNNRPSGKPGSMCTGGPLRNRVPKCRRRRQRPRRASTAAPEDRQVVAAVVGGDEVLVAVAVEVGRRHGEGTVRDRGATEHERRGCEAARRALEEDRQVATELVGRDEIMVPIAVEVGRSHREGTIRDRGAAENEWRGGEGPWRALEEDRQVPAVHVGGDEVLVPVAVEVGRRYGDGSSRDLEAAEDERRGGEAAG